MNKPNVLVVVITKDNVNSQCYHSILQQDYENFSVLISVVKPKHLHENPVCEKYLNCSENRNIARRMALASDAKYFLFVDSDIVLPKNTISSLISHNRHAIGGWYQIRDGKRWVAGKWVADNVFINFKTPDASVIKTDVVGLGCALISREVLEKVQFEPGINVVAENENREKVIVGECGMFGNRVSEAGYNLYVDGDVICKHIF